jgi:AcrR family transcriptional regulator
MSPVPGQGTAAGRPGPEPGPATRRRGAQLEAALLDAAWLELTEVGYGAFTMEGVAARAGTSRAVLYRRWPNRPELAVAAIRQHTRLAAADIPDTGTLRGDVLALLRHVSALAGEIAGVVSFLIADHFNETGMSAAVLRERTLAGEPTAMQIVLDRAVARGEIDPDRLSPRIASLPLDLVRHDLIMNRSPVPDPALIEIVDRIFLPLLRAEPPDVTPTDIMRGSIPTATGSCSHAGR